MLQWMGGSRRKVTTSRGSTQKRQKQYFEQRRRQQQQQTSASDNYLEENGCSAITSNNERRSLDVLSLKTLSTVAKECNSHCLNGLEAAGIDTLGNRLEFNAPAPQPKILANSGNPRKDSVEFASKEEKVCDHPSINETISCNANLDPWKNEISVLDILEDDDLKYDFRENPTSEDHVSFSVGGLGKVGTETPSPPHRMAVDHHGGSLYFKASRGVEMSKNPLNDVEFDVDAVLQDIDTSLSGKSSKFSSYSVGQFETFEKQTPEMCFPIDDDNLDSSFGGFVRGKSAYGINEDYKKNRYSDHPNFMVDEIFNDAQRDLHWEHGPRREYMSEECWEPRNLEENSFKKSHFFSERDTKFPLDCFNYTETEFTTFCSPEKGINLEEVLPRSPPKMNFGTVGMSRNPNQFDSPVKDPKDSSMSSEESCSSSAVRRDKMDSVAKKRHINKIWSPKGHVKCFSREETLHGRRNYTQQLKTAVGVRAETDKLEIENSLLSDMPSHLTVENNLKTKDCWFGRRERPQSEFDSGFSSFCKQSMTKSEAFQNEPWAEGSISGFADSQVGDRSKLDDQKSRYTPHKSAQRTSFFLDPHDSPWNAGLTSKCEMKRSPTRFFGVIESPETYKVPLSVSGYARKDQEIPLGYPSAIALDSNIRKQKIDFFALRIIQIRDEEGCSFINDRKSLKVPKYLEAMKSPAVTTSDKYLTTDNDEYENHHKEDLVSGECVKGCKESETMAIADHTEQKTAAMRNITSPLDSVLKHKNYSVQFMCVQHREG